MMWKISGPNLPAIYIGADSFDAALKIARRRHLDYCSGYVVDEEE